MYRLYELFKVRSGPPTQDELYIASARKKLDGGPTTRAYIPQPEKASENITGAFQRQAVQAAASSLACILMITAHVALGQVRSGSIREASC
jgi:hypothetical protein